DRPLRSFATGSRLPKATAPEPTRRLSLRCRMSAEPLLWFHPHNTTPAQWKRREPDSYLARDSALARLRTPFVAELLHLIPIERWHPRIFPGQFFCPFSYPLKRCRHLIPILAGGIGHQSSHWLSMPGDDDFLSLFHPVKQSSERILRLEGPNLRRLRNRCFH